LHQDEGRIVVGIVVGVVVGVVVDGAGLLLWKSQRELQLSLTVEEGANLCDPVGSDELVPAHC